MHSHSGNCLANQSSEVQEAVLDRLLASFLILLGFVYVSVCFQYPF